MTPDFALSLSFDGIALLHRVPDGWHLVGEVPLDSPDLSTALADLRAKALTLSPTGLRCKLVIPAEQIRFMTLETEKTTRADVEKALEGETPYALHELVIDDYRRNGKTYVAAVAQETLNEAEAFAIEHDFDPVACVAVPDTNTFPGEVFFGPLFEARDENISRDDRPVIQTGIATIPELATAQVDVAQASNANTPSTDDAEVTSASTDVVPEKDIAASVKSPAEAPVFASRSSVAPAAPASAKEIATTTGPQVATLAKAMASAPKSAEQRSATATLRITPEAPARPAMATTDQDAVQAPARLAATPIPPPAEEPLFTRRKEPPPPLIGKGRASSTSALRIETAAEAPVSALTAAAAPMAAPPSSPVAVGRLAAAVAATASAAPRSDRRTAPVPETESAVAPTRGKPRFLGLILTAILLLVLLLIGLWASTLPPGGIAGWFRGGSEDTQVADAADAATISTADVSTPTAAAEDAAAPADIPVLETPTAAAPSAVLPDQDTVVEAPPLPVVRAPAARVLSPDEADRIYAATGVYQRAPRISVVPRTAVLEGVGPVADVLAPDALPQPEMPAIDTVQPDAVIATPPPPPGPNVIFARDDRGNILATPEGTLTPQGAVVFAGSPDLRPILRPGTVVVPTVATPPISPTLRPADLTETATSPVDPAEDTAFVAGPPPVRPVLRPADAAPAAATATPATSDEAAATPIVFTGVRPQLRPTDITPAVQEVIAAYTGARPVLRPASLAPEAVPEAPEAEIAAEEPAPEPTIDINAVAAAIAAAAPRSNFSNRTALAVSVARRPAPRPRNFAQVVARATPATAPAVAAPTRTAAVAATPAPPTIVAPSGNVPGGVARAATVDNAINLRQMNLVGVYGKPNQRRALIRLGNGRYVKVEVGSSLDGGQVTAIGDSALNFVKRGKTYALTLPG